MTTITDISEWYNHQRDEFYNSREDRDSIFDQLDDIWHDKVENEKFCEHIDPNALDLTQLGQLLQKVGSGKFGEICIAETEGNISIFYRNKPSVMFNVQEAIRKARKI